MIEEIKENKKEIDWNKVFFVPPIEELPPQADSTSPKLF